jgi:hypothetical protein
LGGEIDLQEASEPTDIIWENRAFTPAKRTGKRVVVCFFILIMLLISATIIYICSKTSLAMKTKYPTLDCFGKPGDENNAKKIGYIEKEFGGVGGIEKLYVQAKLEFTVNKEYELKKISTHYVGNLQCFC